MLGTPVTAMLAIAVPFSEVRGVHSAFSAEGLHFAQLLLQKKRPTFPIYDTFSAC